MSWEATYWAKKTRGHRSGGEKLLLMVLSDYANKAMDYQCWPSIKLLAEDCESTEKSIINNLNSLEKRGFITRLNKGNQWQPSRYRVNVDGPPKSESEIISPSFPGEGWALDPSEGEIRASEYEISAGESEMQFTFTPARSESEGEIRASEYEISAGEGEIRASEYEISAGEGEIRASEYEISAGEGEIRASEYEISAGEGEIRASEYEISAGEGEIRVGTNRNREPTEEPKVEPSVEPTAAAADQQISALPDYWHPMTELDGYSGDPGATFLRFLERGCVWMGVDPGQVIESFAVYYQANRDSRGWRDPVHVLAGTWQIEAEKFRGRAPPGSGGPLGANPPEGETPHLEAYRRRYGRYPWEREPPEDEEVEDSR